MGKRRAHRPNPQRAKDSDQFCRILDPETREDRTPAPLFLGRREKGETVKGDGQTTVTDGSHTDDSSSRASVTMDDSTHLDETADMDTTKEAALPPARRRKDAPVSDSERWLEEKELMDKKMEAQALYMQQLLSIKLVESDTMWLLSRPDERLPNNRPQSEIVAAANARYDNLLSEKERAPPERFVGRGAQTLTAPLQTKDCGTSCLPSVGTGVQAVGWAVDDERLEADGVIDGDGDERAEREDAEVASDASGAEDADADGSGDDDGKAGDGGADGDADSTADHNESTTGGAESSDHAAGDTTTADGGQQQSTSAPQGKGRRKGAGRRRNAPQPWRKSRTILGVLASVEHAVMEAVALPELLRFHGLRDVLEEAGVRPVGPLRLEDAALDAADKYQKDVPPAGPLGVRGFAPVDPDLAPQEEAEMRAKALSATAATSVSGGGSPTDDSAGERLGGGGAPRASAKLTAMLRLAPAPVCSHLEVQEMAWHAVDHDLLAVGYGVSFTSAVQQPLAAGVPQGYIATYHLANPTTPSRLIPVGPAAITSVAFAKHRPSVLAACRSDGVVALWDLRNHATAPVLSSSTTASDHNGAAWACRWSPTALDSHEGLTSVGADGVVMQWHLRKGLEGRVAMRLKPQAASAAAQATLGSAGGERLLSRLAGGLCLDFSPTEKNNYVVGTEDGSLLKCSTTYSEQYLFDYTGHRGSVYGVRWNPAEPDQFLSCGVDWTVRLWKQHKGEAITTFRCEPAAVLGCAWSYANPRLFGSLSSSSFHLWHTDHPLAPAALYHATPSSTRGSSFRCLSFPVDPNSPVVLVGDSGGSVNILDVELQNSASPADDGGAGEA